MYTLASDVAEVVSVSMVGSILAIWIVFSTFRKVFKRWNFERSRREIAAYVAEGSMTPEDAERLLKSEPTSLKDD